MQTTQSGARAMKDKKIDLFNAIKRGDLTPEKAVENFEIPSLYLGDIGLDLDDTALACGFPTIEHYRYLRQNKPDLVVVAARPGIGKTSLICQLALNVSRKKNVLLYSLEMTAEQLKGRIMAVEAERAIGVLKNLPKEQLETINRNLRSYRLSIDDTNAIHINTLISRTIDFHKRNPLSLVVVDYIQIVACNPMRSKAEEVAFIAEKLKTLAKDIGCPVIAVAQMNRNVEGRSVYTKDMRPMMSDLADSAGIEKWADLVMFLHRQYVYDRTRPGEADVYIVKNRNGESQDFILQFSGEITKFFDNKHTGSL